MNIRGGFINFIDDHLVIRNSKKGIVEWHLCKKKNWDKVLENSGISKPLLLDELIQVEFGLDEKEILNLKRLSNNNYYIELYKNKFFRNYENKSFKLENKHLKGIPKPLFEGKYVDLFPSIARRQDAHSSFLCTEKEILQYKPEWYLTIGLGITSLFETSINLNPVYGVPYIPSSSIKGAVRNFAITNYFKDEADALSNQVFCDLFGCPKSIQKGGEVFSSHYGKEKIGKLIFFDAYPIPEKNKKGKGYKKLQIIDDIMNPHYSDYYGEKTLPPADWHNPKPINFLVIKDTPFQFVVGLKKGQPNESDFFFDEEIMTPMEMAKHLLHETLTTQGIGAKTAVGYGFMEEKK